MRSRDEGMMRSDFGETVGSTEFVFLVPDKGGKILDVDDESEWSLLETMAMFGDVGLSRNGDAA
jgi:hypothetical protein